MKVLAVIPARGGSKRIPRKNVKLMAGKPLIAWTIEEALKAKSLSRLIVSTDDEEIAEISKLYGADVPFLRPQHLSRDESTGVSTALHAINELSDFNWIMLLQPTSPLRTKEDIDGIFEYCIQKRGSSAVSLAETIQSPSWMFTLGKDRKVIPLLNNKNVTQTKTSTTYVLNGALYLAKVEWLKRTQNLIGGDTLGYLMPADRSIDIDTDDDWQKAELLIKSVYGK
jgi:CMP-N,N'-diacetyllegionaminic acid synthase